MKILNNQPETAATSSASQEAGHGDTEVRPAVRMEEVRRSLAAKKGPEYWRSLEELADSEDFQRLVENEFPRYAPQEWDDSVSRRKFLTLAGASIGLAGLTACTRQPEERIVPYVEQPEHLVPGKPTFFATGMTLAGYATGLIAESHMGRPTKLTGNPDHPATAGGSHVWEQAATLGLYDPDRSKSIQRQGRILPWEDFAGAMESPLRALEALQGEGLAILSGTVTSPTFGSLVERVRERFPQARWVQYETASQDAALAAAREGFGEPVETRLDLARADVILALDSDFLVFGPGSLRYARDFSSRRKVRGAEPRQNRLWAIESTPTPSGSLADHRLPARPAEIERFAVALAARLGVPGVTAPTLEDESLNAFLDAVAQDLSAHRGSSVVVAGEHTSPQLQLLVHGINAALDNVGRTVSYTDPVRIAPSDQAAELRQLVEEMSAGRVSTLFVLGANPVYDAPADLDFAAAMQQVNLVVHLGLYKDETGQRATWHVPQAHFLEAWGDARSFDGTVTIVQPLIEPLYGGRTDLELLSLMAGNEVTDYDLVREHWRGNFGEAEFERRWRQALHDGYLADTALAPRSPSLDAGAVVRAAETLVGGGEPAGGEDTVEVCFRLDPSLFDGRFANNGWLMEVPRPLTKITWDNAALMGWETADRLGVATNEVIRLEHEGRSIELPVWVNPGQAEGVITVHLGYGRTDAGRVGSLVGADANRLRSSSQPWHLTGVKVARTGRQRALASTQEHFQMDLQMQQAEERHLVKHATLDYYKEHPDFVEHQGHTFPPEVTMFPPWEYQGYSWGMAVDLSVCTGCNACVVACQAENNIPVVGREQVLAGREMHWLRIDRYYQGDLNRPTVHHQPVMCQHCEKAPCEVVCPVAATVHGPEGLNQMIYNRCVGTRYCSNNCPYKVRRFNFLSYTDHQTPVLKLARNPNVSVRTRGVMEKCTYCVQRINETRIVAKVESRKIRDGEVKTACQEACPTQAIAFGDLNDPSSEVNRWKAEPLDYNLLDLLSTQPRTTYLAKITNPHPALAAETASHDDHGGDAEAEAH